MTKRTRKKTALENRRWHEQQEEQRRRATATARKQQAPPPEGLHPVPLPTLSDGLEELDARGARLVSRPVGSGVKPFVPPPPGYQPDFTKPRSQPMSNFISSQRIKPTKLGTPGGKGNHCRVILPRDLVEAIGLSKLLGMEFEVELNDEGILFRPAGQRPVSLPAWAAGSKERMEAAASGRR